MFTASLLLLPASLVAGLLVLSLYIFNLHSKYDHIPGPVRHSFFLGNAPYLLKRFKEDQSGFTVALEYMQRYGHVFVLWYILKPQVIVTNPETIKDLIISNVHGKQDKRPEARLFGQRFVGAQNVVVNKGDEVWQRNRRAYTKYFGRNYMRQYHDQVKIVAGRLVEKMSELAGTGEVVDLSHWIHLASCDIIGLVALDWDIHAVLKEDSTFPKYLDLVMKGVAFAAGKPISRIAPKFRSMRAEVTHAVRELRKSCAAQIKEHIARKVRGEVTESCLLDEILSQSSGDQEYQIDEMLTMFLAGQETVAHTLSFAMCHLMRDPVILDSVDRDVQGYITNPSFEKLAGMVHMDNLMKETLRHYGAVPGLRRILSKETDIAGYKVPKGTEIVHVLKLYAHDEKIWGSDHKEFNPGRFDNYTFSTSKEMGTPGPTRTPTRRTNVHHDQNRHPHGFLPFGIGPRNCMGKELAKIEFKSVISHLLYHFKFTPVKGENIQLMRYNSVKPLSGQRCYVDLIE